MIQDSERYEICLRCLEEDDIRYADLGFSSIEVRKLVRKCIDNSEEWRNPWYRHSADLCGYCCYALEHIVIAQNEKL